MEIQGLMDLFDMLDEQGINVAALVTDRHSQIAKWMRTSREMVLHVFDIWHITKGTQVYFAILPAKLWMKFNIYDIIRKYLNHIEHLVFSWHAHVTLSFLTMWDSSHLEFKVHPS